MPFVTHAFETLVRRHQDVVLRTCSRYLGNREDAEDACQEVFLRVFHGLSGFQSRSSFRTWLFRIVANTCHDRHRRSRSERAVRVDYDSKTMEPASRDPGTDGSEIGILDGEAGQALALLSTADRQVLILRHVGELSFHELANVIGLGESAAKMRLYRAETRMREVFGQLRQAPVSQRDSGRS